MPTMVDKIRDAIGEDSRIKLGLALALGAVFWWASDLTLKVNTLLTFHGEARAQVLRNTDSINELRHRFDLIDITGTKALESLNKRLDIIENARKLENARKPNP